MIFVSLGFRVYAKKCIHFDLEFTRKKNNVASRTQHTQLMPAQPFSSSNSSLEPPCSRASPYKLLWSKHCLHLPHPETIAPFRYSPCQLPKICKSLRRHRQTHPQSSSPPASMDRSVAYPSEGYIDGKNDCHLDD